jgi:hypothetical protein
MKGHFSTLSKTLTLKTPYGFSDGKCAAPYRSLGQSAPLMSNVHRQLWGFMSQSL